MAGAMNLEEFFHGFEASYAISAEWKEVVQPRQNRYMHHLEIWKPASVKKSLPACEKPIEKR